MATDHHDELEGLRTRVAELEELVQQLGQQLDGLSEHLEYRFQRHHERIEAIDDDARRRDQDLEYQVAESAATPRAGPGTPRPAAAGSSGVAGRLAELAGLPALGLVGESLYARGADRPRLRRRVREPCARTRTGRLPAGRAATWPPPASRALRYSLRCVPRVPAGPPAAALDPAVVQAARRHRSPGAGEEQRPTSRQGGDTSCGDAAAW
jgi:hypothetical protein